MSRLNAQLMPQFRCQRNTARRIDTNAGEVRQVTAKHVIAFNS